MLIVSCYKQANPNTAREHELPALMAISVNVTKGGIYGIMTKKKKKKS